MLVGGESHPLWDRRGKPEVSPCFSVEHAVERRKIKRMNQFSYNINIHWKYHNEAPCIVLLNKKCLFFPRNRGR
jgi:hypothetical protein